MSGEFTAMIGEAGHVLLSISVDGHTNRIWIEGPGIAELQRILKAAQEQARHHQMTGGRVVPLRPVDTGNPS